MNNNKKIINRCLMFTLLLWSAVVQAKVVYVDAGSTAVTPTGKSWETAYPDLTTALNAAVALDDIWVAAGEYTAPASAPFPLKAGVDMYGGFHPTEAPIFEVRDCDTYVTILKGNGKQVLIPAAGKENTYIDGFSITAGGDAGKTMNGGGAYLRAGWHLVNCRVYGNKSKNGAVNLDGGATVADNLIPSLTDCVIEKNESVQGSVYYNTKGIVTDCILRNNKTTGDGGGAYLNVNCVLENTLVENNAGVRGGGIFFRLGGLVKGCIVRNNKGTDDGGGIYFNSGGEVVNSEISYNTSDGDGGGLFTLYNTAYPTNKNLISNCTVVCNLGNSGGGIAAQQSTDIENCVIANNEARNNGGGVWSVGAAIVNSTITRNKALYEDAADTSKGLGGGVFLDGAVSGTTLSAPTFLRNSVVWGNSIAKLNTYPQYTQIRNVFMTDGYRGNIDYCAIEGADDAAVKAQINGVGSFPISKSNATGPMFVKPSSSAGISFDDASEEDVNRTVSLSLVTKSTAFRAGDNSVYAYRIPSIVTAKDGSLIVVCEARKSSWMDKSPTNIAIKRSTDNGATWSVMKIVMQQSGTQAYMDPCPVVDRNSGRIFIFATRWASRTSVATQNTAHMSYSDDNGVTWSSPADVTAQIVAANRYITGFAPGSGLQMRHENYKDRLIVPTRQYNVSTSASETRIVYSNDGGTTWQIGNGSTPTGELQVAEGKDGVLISNMRTAGARRVGYSYNGGVSWSSITQDPTLSAPAGGCQGSVLGGEKVLFYSGPQGGAKNTGYDDRYTLKLWRSLNNGKTWGQNIVLYDKAAGYSCMTYLSDGRIALVFETADTKGFTTSSSRPAGWMRLDVLILPADITDTDCWIVP